MKKLVTKMLAVVMALSIVMVAFAAPASAAGYTVRINGNGNNARIQVLAAGTVVHTSAARPANNAWYQVTLESGTVVAVFVRGNGVDTVNITAPAAPNTPSGTDTSVSGPNNSSGDQGVQRIGNVEIRGNGNNARIWINNQNTGVRPANNTYTTVEFAGYTIEVFVRGNAILRWTLIAAECTEEECEEYEECDKPYIVDEYSFYRFVRLYQVDSIFEGTSEVAGSREFVNGAVALYNWVRNNNFPGVNGQGVSVGATVTGTLNYEYVRNYLEQFERVYEWVDVTVWSDGERDEVVRADSEHVRGDLVDGDEYYTGPYASSRPIKVSGGNIILHMGFQGGLHDRTADVVVGAFTVNFELLNTGNSPSNTVVRLMGYDVYAM